MRKQASRSQRGATMIEFSALIALVAVVGILSIRATGRRVNDQYMRTSRELGASGFVDDEGLFGP